jgi:arabinogalactan oligomer/maltooligosaccharide transport system permease protein
MSRPAVSRTHATGHTIALTLNRLVLIVACLITLFPAIWVFAASFSQGTSLYSGGLIPAKTTLANYAQLFFRDGHLGGTDFLLWMKNSLIICIPASLLAVGLTTTMAYAFSRFHFVGRRFGLLALILIQMFPAIMSIIALFRLLQVLSLLDQYLGLILVYGCGNIGFNTWLLRGYLESIPKDLEEAAYIDGATYWQAFTKIVLPMATPMLVVVFFFNFIGFFQEYLLASIIIFRPVLRPIALGMRFYINGKYSQNWTGFSAASIVASLPILIIFFALQKFIVEGLTKGALKG